MTKMKLLLSAMLILTAGIYATNLNDPSIKKEEVRVQIIDLLKASPFNAASEDVLITFTFSSEGQIVVLNVDSKNSYVLNYIRKNLNYKKIEKPGKKDEIYKLPLKFKSKYKS
jgi:hypothetical protein